MKDRLMVVPVNGVFLKPRRCTSQTVSRSRKLVDVKTEVSSRTCRKFMDMKNPVLEVSVSVEVFDPALLDPEHEPVR